MSTLGDIKGVIVQANGWSSEAKVQQEDNKLFLNVIVHRTFSTTPLENTYRPLSGNSQVHEQLCTQRCWLAPRPCTPTARKVFVSAVRQEAAPPPLGQSSTENEALTGVSSLTSLEPSPLTTSHAAERKPKIEARHRKHLLD